MKYEKMQMAQRMYMAGARQKDIAKKLGLSESTVYNYTGHLALYRETEEKYENLLVEHHNQSKALETISQALHEAHTALRIEQMESFAELAQQCARTGHPKNMTDEQRKLYAIAMMNLKGYTEQVKEEQFQAERRVG